MRITERQARRRLEAAVEAAGSQVAFARTIPGTTEAAAQIRVSRALSGSRPIDALTLTALGLRRDGAGDIHTVEPARVQILAVHAEGEAAVGAAVALVSTLLGRT